jgi:hypothetical protein
MADTAERANPRQGRNTSELERKVLADARTIVGGYALVGEFAVSLWDVLLDFYAIDTAAQARDIDATQLAIAKLQMDTLTAISLDKAPGIPPEADMAMRQLQAVDRDFANLFRAALAQNRSAVEAAKAAGWADAAKLHAIDVSRVTTEIAAYYSPLVDAYEADVARAAAA